MRVLLSTIGSRGDVQPLVALASRLHALGHRVRLCLPPDFRGWVSGLGFDVTPIGPELRRSQAADLAGPPTPEQVRARAEASVVEQFEVIGAAAEGCDLLVGATALQIAAPSIAESRGIPYVFVAYCPAVLPSPLHAPPSFPAGDPATNQEMWARDAERFTASFGAVLDARRAALGLGPVADVRSHVLTDRPWLAADPVLAPWPGGDVDGVVVTGAWILPDERPLPAALAAFLDAGEPPVYVGFGSMQAPEGAGAAAVAAARAVGRRVVVHRGWGELTPGDDGADVLVVGEVNQQALFPRTAAVVHHGGAGTTTAAARAGAPQVVVPLLYDQHYFARRVGELGVGAAHAPGAPTARSLAAALDAVLRPEVAQRARSVAAGVRADGAQVAAERLAALAHATDQGRAGAGAEFGGSGPGAPWTRA